MLQGRSANAATTHRERADTHVGRVDRLLARTQGYRMENLEQNKRTLTSPKAFHRTRVGRGAGGVNPRWTDVSHGAPPSKSHGPAWAALRTRAAAGPGGQALGQGRRCLRAVVPRMWSGRDCRDSPLPAALMTRGASGGSPGPTRCPQARRQCGRRRHRRAPQRPRA